MPRRSSIGWEGQVPRPRDFVQVWELAALFLYNPQCNPK